LVALPVMIFKVSVKFWLIKLISYIKNFERPSSSPNASPFLTDNLF